ncbi:MAG TPA: alanine--glyoxylate aminotransferase family protein [Gemmatimonadaceae bacterium]
MSDGPSAFGTFFLPGPTEVRPEVLGAMTRPMIAHRGAAFEALFARIQARLRPVFRTTRPVLVCSASASGLMEGAVRCAPEGPILSLVNGAFSERFARIAQACEREVSMLEVPWGATFDLDEVEHRLAERRWSAVTVVHSETSTGVLTDVRTVTALAHRHGAVALVDSVSGVAGAPLEFDAWEMDFVFTGSQKALAVPPGLALGVATPELIERARSVRGRGRYLDLVELEEYALRDQTPATPALPLFYALDAQLDVIAREGVEARWRRHEAMARATWAWAERVRERHGVEVSVLAREGSRSPTVSAITAPPGARGGAIAAAVATRGFVIGGGYGKLRDATFRIGHMGEHDVAGVERCLAVVEEVLVSEIGAAEARGAGRGARGALGDEGVRR